jgi:serine/threonine protein kinase
MKPDNLVFSEDMIRLLICDFGLSNEIQAKENEACTTDIRGTPAYMSSKLYSNLYLMLITIRSIQMPISGINNAEHDGNEH